jgi:FixJ family two-component response regulator
LQETLISIVDDNADILEAMRALVRSMGFRVDVFLSATQFLSSPTALDNTRCLIVDLQMPKITGIELFEKLKEIERNIPTILMTAYSTPAIAARAHEVGIMCCLSKPLDGDQLLDWIPKAIAMGR